MHSQYLAVTFPPYSQWTDQSSPIRERFGVFLWLKVWPMLLLSYMHYHIGGLGQERRNSIANALELCLFCSNSLISDLCFTCSIVYSMQFCVKLDHNISRVNCTWTWQFKQEKTVVQCPGVGVTKPISFGLLFSKFCVIVKTHISNWISHLYLAGVATAQLWWHLSNMNVILRI